MKRNQIRHVVIHNAENANQSALSDKISVFHAGVIERRLAQLPLTAEQKIAVVNKIIEDLKLREINGVIK